MNNDHLRRSISATLAEIEQYQLPKLEIVDKDVAPDDDAAEALEIVKRIEGRLIDCALQTKETEQPA